jgi:DNA-directed RNA polymerase subunit RPC12/RpoP
VLVATKCDVRCPEGPLETTLGRYEIHQTSPELPQKQKMCIAVILRDVFSQRDGKCEHRRFPHLAVCPRHVLRKKAGKNVAERERENNSGFGHATIPLYTNRPLRCAACSYGIFMKPKLWRPLWRPVRAKFTRPGFSSRTSCHLFFLPVPEMRLFPRAAKDWAIHWLHCSSFCRICLRFGS